MLQALPENRSADALVDARQALVRRVVAAAPVDVGAAPVWKQNLGRPTPSTRPRPVTGSFHTVRHGIAVDESRLIIVVQLQLCAVARHAAKFPVQHQGSRREFSNFGCSEMVSSIVRVPGGTCRNSESGKAASVALARAQARFCLILVCLVSLVNSSAPRGLAGARAPPLTRGCESIAAPR